MNNSCTCECQCKPDSISFWWMNDNHTFIRLKGKNLDEIISHARKIMKKSKGGMLCPATLLRNDRDFRKLGIGVHDDENFEVNVKKWKECIQNDNFAPILIQENKIDK